MRSKVRLRSILTVLFSILLLLCSASTLLAQSEGGENSAAGAALAGGVLLIILVAALAGYVYVSLALQTIAKKTNTADGWLAWIPIVNIVLMLNIAKRPVWWLILFFVPLVNIVINILVWMAIAEARNKPNWWGILTIVPVANFVVPGYLAWSD